VKPVLIAFSALALSACASPQQLAVVDDQACQSMGALPGSDAYLQCRLIQQQRHDRQRRERINAFDALRDRPDAPTVIVVPR
jgi:hypothetical protein